MPLYDRKCDSCTHRRNDCYEQSSCADYYCPECPRGRLIRIPMTQNPGAMGRAIGDECEVLARHGLCNPDGSPRRYTSKSAMAQEAKRRGLTNLVEHKPGPNSDRCKETQRWI